LICSAIEHCKAGGKPKDSPVTLVWADYLAKLHQYVTTVRNESGHVVTRLATLSGQWIVTFNDPEAIFLAPEKVNPLLIGIYRGDELITQAGIIFEQLARSSINNALPEMIRPSPCYRHTSGQPTSSEHIAPCGSADRPPGHPGNHGRISTLKSRWWLRGKMGRC
jgi:hypothetical protein